MQQSVPPFKGSSNLIEHSSHKTKKHGDGNNLDDIFKLSQSNEHSYSIFDDKWLFFLGEENNYIKAP